MKSLKISFLLLPLFLLAVSLQAAEPFSVVVLPDTQNYCGENFPIRM